jgi:MiaB/RimO family radical SAM methylthiotransferase
MLLCGRFARRALMRTKTLVFPTRSTRLFASSSSSSNRVPDEVPDLMSFMQAQQEPTMLGVGSEDVVRVRDPEGYKKPTHGGKYYIESYGCQMNMADTEIVHSVLQESGMKPTDSAEDANYILINTCAIRENAETRIWGRLTYFRKVKRDSKVGRGKDAQYGKVIGVLGCMAERLKEQLIESDKMVDVVVGPDAYRDLPRLLGVADEGETAVNTMLSLDETYADISPVRIDRKGVTAFLSIMRGCDNMCSYCIVPFTRGRERSRDVQSILREAGELAEQGVKEITLLGQNVNSYNFVPEEQKGLHGRVELTETKSAKSTGFVNISRRPKEAVSFTHLLKAVCDHVPNVRIRFTSPHPKDFPEELLDLMACTPNLCSNIHIPIQSGSDGVLESMRRGYTKQLYLDLVDVMTARVPGVTLSTDIIAGFCGESEEDHEHTLDVMRRVDYSMAFMFKYSQRAKTRAARRMQDDVPEDVKGRRLQEIIDVYQSKVLPLAQAEVGVEHLVLVEKDSRRSEDVVVGRTDTNKKVFVPKVAVADLLADPSGATVRVPAPGDYVVVKVIKAEPSLQSQALAITSLVDYHRGAEYASGERSTASVNATASN